MSTTRAQIGTLFEARMRAWRDRDATALAASHGDHGIIVSPIFGTVSGRAAIDQSYHDLFKRFADWALTAEPPIIDDHRVAQPFEVHATHTYEIFGLAATGRKFKIQGVLLFEVKDGRIAHERRVYDFTGLLLQLGVLKARPS
jgi:steroid delta-isomerase-like uncharacterized protein